MAFERTRRFSLTARLLGITNDPNLLFIHLVSRDERGRAYDLLKKQYSMLGEEWSGQTRLEIITALKAKDPENFYLHLLSLGDTDPEQTDLLLAKKLLLEVSPTKGVASKAEPAKVSDAQIYYDMVIGLVEFRGKLQTVVASILPWGDPSNTPAEAESAPDDEVIPLPIIRRRGDPNDHVATTASSPELDKIVTKKSKKQRKLNQNQRIPRTVVPKRTYWTDPTKVDSETLAFLPNPERFRPSADPT